MEREQSRENQGIPSSAESDESRLGKTIAKIIDTTQRMALKNYRDH